jgi:hypothetical protein
MGAYYTPEEITGFMARRTVHPYLLDQLNEAVGASYDDIDDVFGFIGADASGESAALADGGMVTQQAPTENVNVAHVETLYHDILKEAKLLDPAVGSGAFLLAGQEVLLDIYMQCIEFFQRLEDEGKGWELSSRTRDELDAIASGKGNASLYAKRTIILNNLYGVDIDEGAVEICKLRLWLSMVADIEDEPGEVEPLPNIDFNIRQGNSLIGFTELIETSDNGDATLANYGGGVGDSVREKYDQVIDAIQNHKDAGTSKEATNWRRIAEERIERYRGDLNEKILERFRQAGVEDVSLDDVERYSPFHWVLEFAEVYSEGGFNVIIGNPPWDVLTPNREEFFSRYDEVFRSRTQNQKDEIQEELLEDSDVEQEWEKYQHDFEIRAQYFNNSPDYTLQKPEVAGKTVGNNQNDLSALFFERAFTLAQDSSRVAQILPGVLFNGSTQKDLRVHLLEETTVDSIVGFENNGIFDDLHQQYKFGVVSFKNSGQTDHLRGIFQQKSVDILTKFEKKAVSMPAEVLLDFSPEARVFPYITSQQEVSVLSKILEHPSIGEEVEDTWKINPYTELHSSKDSEYFLEDSSEADYPIYQGKNIYQFAYDNSYIDVETAELFGVNEESSDHISAKNRVRSKNYRNLKRGIYDAFDGDKTSKSQKAFVNDLLEETRGKPLTEEDVRLDSAEERIVFRQVTNSTNERTLVASLIPKDVLCVDTLTTVKPQEVDPSRDDLTEYPLHDAYKRSFTDRELLVALGLLNSIPFDFLMRTKVDSHIVMYKLNESQLPRLTDGDNWFNYISERAARLNCYGEEFEEMRGRLGGINPATTETERRTVQAEMDAAAFHAYGLDRRETEFVLDSFYKVSSPRMMTENYFDMVFEKYDLLEQEGPHP